MADLSKLSADQIVALTNDAGVLLTSQALAGARQGLDTVNVPEATWASFASKAFGATTASINIGTSETPLLLFTNPNASGKVVKVYSVALASSSGTFRIYQGPTVTANGTSLTKVNKHFQASPPAPVATAFSQPTTSANGNIFITQVTTSQGGTTLIDLTVPITMDANTSLLVTVQNGANNTPTVAAISWAEF